MNDLMIAMLLASGVGLGLFITLRGFRRRPAALADTMVALDRSTATGAPAFQPRVIDDLSGLQRYLARPGLRMLESLGVTDRGLLETQLRVLDKSVERHAYEKMFGAVVGVILPLFVGLFFSANRIEVSPLIMLIAAIGLGALGFFYPDIPLNEKVLERQSAFRHSLASYLDLVTIILAGGGGTESALVGAAEAGDSWVFAEIRAALRRGELTGRSPWEMFDELGAHYQIDELRELAASVALAGGQGARVRQSLIAKAEALRSQQSASIESEAESNTEKMIIPVSLMVLGLMVFIGRGAAAIIFTPTGGSEIEQSADE